MITYNEFILIKTLKLEAVNMKKKILSILLIAASLSCPFQVYASETGWIPHEYCPDISTYQGSWEYLYSNGQHAQNWALINNKWYYFSPEDGCAYRNTYLTYNDQVYYLKDDCSMACNEYVYSPETGGYVYADSEGRLLIEY